MTSIPLLAWPTPKSSLPRGASACLTRSAPRRCAVSIAEASVEEIDRLNILQATLLAMRRAVKGLRLKPALVLVDGNRLPVLDARRGHRQGRCAGARHLGRLHPGQGAPRPLVRRRSTSSTRNTALPGTRATARPRTWLRCASTALAIHHRRSFAPVAVLV
jgi:ribonuclease HII